MLNIGHYDTILEFSWLRSNYSWTVNAMHVADFIRILAAKDK